MGREAEMITIYFTSESAAANFRALHAYDHSGVQLHFASSPVLARG